jgi:hypothetical protein
MDDLCIENNFRKEAKDYFCSSEKYCSKIIDLVLKKNYSACELLTNFNSKPTFYRKLKCLLKGKIIMLDNDKFSINAGFKKELECYSVYYFMIKNVNNASKFEAFKKEMLDACKELEIILGFREG